MYRDLYLYKLKSEIMNKTYWRWYKYIEDDVSDEVIGIEAEVEIEIRD